jgi:hypothetical protein
MSKTNAEDTRRKARPINGPKDFRVGHRQSGQAHGGGGPENAGARSDQQANISLRQPQPSWAEFESDFIGVARPTDKPNLAGGGGHYTHNDLKSNAFRALGDVHGGRQ